MCATMPSFDTTFFECTGFFGSFVFLRQGLTHSVAKAGLELATLLPQSLSAITGLLHCAWQSGLLSL